MVKRVFIVHGWDGNPCEGWFPDLKKKLEKRGFKVKVPKMPKPAAPQIKTWVAYLAKIVGKPDQNTFFVGHSIGCQTILRYLESLPLDLPVSSQAKNVNNTLSDDKKRGISFRVGNKKFCSLQRAKKLCPFFLKGSLSKNFFKKSNLCFSSCIVKHESSLPLEQKVGGAIFVAGWFTLMNLETKEAQIIAEPWLKTPIDCEKIKKHTKKFVAIFSDNDDVVPRENQEMFRQRLGARIIVEHGKGHFSGSDGVKKLPSALQAILEMAKIN